MAYQFPKPSNAKITGYELSVWSEFIDKLSIGGNDYYTKDIHLAEPKRISSQFNANNFSFKNHCGVVSPVFSVVKAHPLEGMKKERGWQNNISLEKSPVIHYCGSFHMVLGGMLSHIKPAFRGIFISQQWHDYTCDKAQFIRNKPELDSDMADKPNRKKSLFLITAAGTVIEPTVTEKIWSKNNGVYTSLCYQEACNIATKTDVQQVADQLRQSPLYYPQH